MKKNKTNTLKFFLHRNGIRPLTCDGVLCDGQGNRICSTAEATPFMLPPGEYAVGRFADVFGRSNGVYALTDSTILIGTPVVPDGYSELMRVPGVVIRTADAYDRMRRRVNKARERGTRLVLVITN